jgi:uncharacterized protein YijF (DUF1287 family)
MNALPRIVLALALASWSLMAGAFSAERFIADARAQIGKTLFYDPRYVRIPYPMGDIPLIRGVCTDVVIRALRAQDIDLQQRIHVDMRKNFHLYPRLWGLKAPDANIDHRRVPNIRRYLERRGYAIDDVRYAPGDIVTWNLGRGTPHIGIVSDHLANDGKTPLIIHNIGLGVQEENILFRYEITAHYRIPHRAARTEAPAPSVAPPERPALVFPSSSTESRKPPAPRAAD